MAERLADMAEHERPRERLAEHGAAALRDAELLALVLRTGHAGVSALALADRLLAAHGGLVGLASARADELARRHGVGPAKAASVVAACQLATRVRAGQERVPVLRSAADVADVAIPLLLHCTTPRVVSLVVDGTGALRRVTTVAEDGMAPSPELVREALTGALHHGGGGLAIATHHPDGDPEPREVDRLLAEAVGAGAASIGLHFVAGVTIAGRLWEEVPTRLRRGTVPG